MKKLLLIAAILLAACSPQKRLGSLLKNHPELSDSFTVVVTDTVWTPEVTYDTLFRNVTEVDTLYAGNDTVQVTIFKTKTELRTVVKVKPYPVVERDTITRTVIKPTYVESKPGWKWYLKWSILPWMLLGVMVFWWIIRR